MLKKLKQSKQEGFTIIEVLIVLAIAGLIILIVFLAVPALKRNSRNSQRKNDISAMLGAISEYNSNNNGQAPGKATYANGEVTFDCVGAGGVTCTAVKSTAKLAYYTQAPGFDAAALATAPTTDIVEIRVKNKCLTSGTTTTSGASSRGVAVVYMVEAGNGLQTTCQEG